ncbi:replication initiator [Luteococcus sp. Sow4_B9]|uniref:replication initiator n=1 Tax=Luteococcus sp. Sow4_B9 TaxID=3438792 RepID=UPI003F9D7710
MTSTITAAMAAELADDHGVCRRPVIRRVHDRQTGTEQTVAMACGATLDSRCPACAHKARTLRMHQCREGWHLDHEPERAPVEVTRPASGAERRVRSTRRRQDAPNLPRVPMDSRTIGQAFETPDGKAYRPSMFVTLTLPSYGAIIPGSGIPADPARYDYRRAALDALFFSRLVDQFWKALRRCAGYDVQYFSAVEPQRRLAPHVHAAIRGAIPRDVLRQVACAVYLQVWWPRFDRALFSVENPPIWTGTDYADPQTGAILPTWEEAMDTLDADPHARPAHIMRFGTQTDIKGIIAPSEDADRAVRYLVKYLNKSIAEPFADGDEVDAAYEAHIDRLHAELRWLPCSEQCSNWLLYGVQPAGAVEGMVPGSCPKKHHDREHLGLGGRRCLVSRKWSGKTLKRHRADRAAVVREALAEAGITAPEIERISAEVQADDGQPRYEWHPVEVTPGLYTRTILHGIQERARWRAEYARAEALGVNSAAPP